MEPELIIYQKFYDLALANALAGLLEAQDVNYSLEEEAQSFNPTFSYVNTKEYVVKVRAKDFELVNELLRQNANEDIGDVDNDYYLLTFSDAELMEVVTKADEWSAFDVQLARKLLAERGNALSDEKFSDIKRQRVKELKTPESSQLTWIVMGYIIAVGGIIMPFFICIIGLFIGWHLSSYKKTLPDGEQVYAYNETDRKHGKRIFFIGAAIFLLGLVTFILSAYKASYHGV